MTRILMAFTLALALAACATPVVYTDYNPAAQFANYRTYSWSEKPAQVSPLMAQRIVDAVNVQLRAKGWTEVAADGDVAIAASVATHQELDMYTYGSPYWGGWGWGGWGGWGGWPGWGGWGMYGSYDTHVRSYTVGTLAVDMFDAKTHQAIWRGTAEGTVKKDPVKAAADIQTSVTKMFATFPPASVPAQ